MSLQLFVVLVSVTRMLMECHESPVSNVAFIIPADETIALAAVSSPVIALLGEYSPEELQAAQLSEPDIRLILTFRVANQHPETLPENNPGDR